MSCSAELNMKNVLQPRDLVSLHFILHHFNIILNLQITLVSKKFMKRYKQVSNDQEMRHSERKSLSKNRGGKN